MAVLEAGWSLTEGSSSSNIITFMLLRYIVSCLFNTNIILNQLYSFFAFKAILPLLGLFSKVLL